MTDSNERDRNPEEDKKFTDSRIETLINYIKLHLQPSSIFWEDIDFISVGISYRNGEYGPNVATKVIPLKRKKNDNSKLRQSAGTI
jgi:hypothetical protein